MANRKHITQDLETIILTACYRRCCLCFFLNNQSEVKKGQIAHLNRNPNDNRLQNLVWLCLEHHDDYDSRSSQSKGITKSELKHYWDKLLAHYHTEKLTVAESAPQESTPDGKLATEYSMLAAWKIPTWREFDKPVLFAYKAINRIDGICVIEIIDIPDGRTVVACIAVPGNSGNSITNSVELICGQVCHRFKLDVEKLVWLENYDYIHPEEWEMVIFGRKPPSDKFANPVWLEVTPMLWRSLKLHPLPKLGSDGSRLLSKLEKLFPGPEPDDFSE